jgi:quinol monooxygenase YgiN
MHIVLVYLHIKPEFVEMFKTVSQDNAQGSLEEAGIVRFDVLQQGDDPNRFLLYEVYHSPDDQLKHRETAHYQRWKDAVADMMAEPRVGIRYTNVAPADENFSQPK